MCKEDGQSYACVNRKSLLDIANKFHLYCKFQFILINSTFLEVYIGKNSDSKFRFTRKQC